VNRDGFFCLEAVERLWRSAGAGRRLTIDLPAWPLGLVDEDRPNAAARERLGSTKPRWARSDDNDGISHDGLRG
jgi:hypothetical protein